MPFDISHISAFSYD
jgi:hypothetical protein